MFSGIFLVIDAVFRLYGSVDASHTFWVCVCVGVHILNVLCNQMFLAEKAAQRK